MQEGTNMSRTYEGDFVNPTEHMRVIENPDHERGGYIIGVVEYCSCGKPCCSKPVTDIRPHTNGKVFDEADDADDYLDNLREKAEQDYDDYLEENHDAIVQMERYEMWKREY